MRGSRRLALALVAAGVGLSPQAAFAFCRTTTCDTTDPTEHCESDGRGCIVEGTPLYWPGLCVSFAVQRDGSVKRGIPFEQASPIIEDAFRAWISADCGGGTTPSLEIWNFGALDCTETQFNQLEPNANGWIFRDDSWPYRGANATLALTTLTFEVNSGEILDADVEVNSHNINLTTSDTVVDNDLLSIATHEAGHFLGLAHTNIKTATMNADYSPGDLSFRSLEADDQAAICDAYPPSRDVADKCAPRPLHGFSRFCGTGVDELKSGCAIASPLLPRSGRFAGAALVLVVGLGIARRRRRRAGAATRQGQL